MVYCLHETESCCHKVRGQAARAASLLDLFSGCIEILSPLPASTVNTCSKKRKKKKGGERRKILTEGAKPQCVPSLPPAAAVSNHFHSVSGSVKSPISFMTEIFITEGGT